MNQGVQVCGEAPASVLLATYPEAELLDCVLIVWTFKELPDCLPHNCSIILLSHQQYMRVLLFSNCFNGC